MRFKFESLCILCSAAWLHWPMCTPPWSTRSPRLTGCWLSATVSLHRAVRTKTSCYHHPCVTTLTSRTVLSSCALVVYSHPSSLKYYGWSSGVAMGHWLERACCTRRPPCMRTTISSHALTVSLSLLLNHPRQPRCQGTACWCRQVSATSTSASGHPQPATATRQT